MVVTCNNCGAEYANVNQLDSAATVKMVAEGKPPVALVDCWLACPACRACLLAGVQLVRLFRFYTLGEVNNG